ncbi:MAG TPA: GNAT family N-acetyltransferase [Candidatus Rifleibacterium sp.]|nr:GNAT family N-acetyltransferase [Candidatus Rifleibacterium sp.]HPT46491.1 GNAT family N-acetyltransferase [Candidatus Rifleibacterium sp.]
MTHKVNLIQPDPQDWQILEQIAEIDRQAFGEDGISVFNLSQFARSGAVFCLALGPFVVAEAVILRKHQDTGAVVFGFAVEKGQRRHGHATALLEQIAHLAVETGISSLELTMNPENEAAYQLYIKRGGFKKVAELALHPHKHEPRWLVRLDLGK